MTSLSLALGIERFTVFGTRNPRFATGGSAIKYHYKYNLIICKAKKCLEFVTGMNVGR